MLENELRSRRNPGSIAPATMAKSDVCRAESTASARKTPVKITARSSTCFQPRRWIA